MADLLGADVHDHVFVLFCPAAVKPLEHVVHHHAYLAPLPAQRFLDFNGDGRVRTLQVGTGNDHAVDVGGAATGTLKRLFRGADGHFHWFTLKARPVIGWSELLRAT